jgi:hypothetical protein
MEDLKYDTVQDKLLVMLIERISVLEDKLSEQSVLLEQLLSLSAFKYFNITIIGKLINANYELLNDTIILQVIKAIDEKIPIIKTWTNFYTDKTMCTITFETKKNWMLSTIQDKLNDIYFKLEVNITGAIYKSDKVCDTAILFTTKDKDEWILSI